MCAAGQNGPAVHAAVCLSHHSALSASQQLVSLQLSITAPHLPVPQLLEKESGGLKYPDIEGSRPPGFPSFQDETFIMTPE